MESIGVANGANRVPRGVRVDTDSYVRQCMHINKDQDTMYIARIKEGLKYELIVFDIEEDGKFEQMESVEFTLDFELRSIIVNESETFVYSAILFVWCELWTLLGLIKFKRKKQN